jgi:hypothetical protein
MGRNVVRLADWLWWLKSGLSKGSGQGWIRTSEGVKTADFICWTLNYSLSTSGWPIGWARNQSPLKQEQADWLKQREKVTRIAGKREEGGSARPMEENDAFIEFTEKRIQLLNNRLKKVNLTSDSLGS